MRNYENIRILLELTIYKDGQFYREGGSLIKPFKHGKGRYMYIEVIKSKVRYRASVHCLVFALHYGIEELMKHETIDHINGDKYDNQIDNLQGLTRFENSYKDSGGKLTVEMQNLLRNGWVKVKTEVLLLEISVLVVQLFLK
jgi:hypothetical protein